VPPLGQNRVRSLATLTAFFAAIVLLGSSSGASFGATSSNYSTILFSDGFESGSLSAWDGNSGNGSATVGAAAAHTGSYGVRLTNTTGQVDVVVKALSAPVVDSSVSFWVRVGSAAGDQTIAEARDAASASRMWALIYDSAAQGFWFYPYHGSSSTEIFTGANTARLNTWMQVEIRYTATSTGGSQLLINGATQPGWGVSGDYTRTDNLQRVQLWNDATNATDFDDVVVAEPGTNATAPGAPSGVVGSAGNGSVALSWSAPASDGGSAITAYRVTPYVGGVAQTPLPTGSASTSYTVTGLTNGTAYTFRVAAINAVGTGPDSAASAAVTPVAGAPGAPTGVSGTAGNGQVAVSWTAPSSNGGSAITGYRVTPYVGGVAQAPVPTGSASTSYTVTGLTNGTAYTFRVAAINAVGTGPDSAPSAAVTPGTIPGAPSAVVGSAGNRSVALSWSAPSSNGGSAITGYRVTPYVGGVAQAAVSTGSASTSYTVTGLTNGTSYTFRVAAINAVGTGPDSTPSAAVTPSATVPGAPSGVVGSAGNASVALSWSAPAADGGSAITGYRITPYVAGVAQASVSTGSAATSYTVTGLTNGTAYTFKVAAINVIGAGPDSAASAAVTPAAVTQGAVTPAPMPVIDHNLPSFGDTGIEYDPSLGNDNNYGSGSGAYLCTPPCSLIIDLSSVPVAKRQQVVVAWYNDSSLFYAAAINSSYYNEPRDYTIDVSSAPGGGSPPTSWTTLVSVSGNVYNGREHFLDLNGANWIRMHVTAVNGSSGNMDASFNLDVHDASLGTNDSWLILGDSITEDDMGHYEPSNFMQQVNAAYPAYFPSQINGGIGGWDASSPLQTDPRTGRVYIDEFLAAFPGHFVSLDYGTNDANEGGAALATYTANMTTMINKVIAAGKVPVLRRTIPWGCTPAIQVNGPVINADLANLLKAFPQAIPGPDEWAYFQAHQSQISSDCIHPTIGTGNAAYRQVYVNALLSSVYGSGR